MIPIIREKGNPPTPTFLQTKLYVDFTKDSEVEFALDDLLRHLLNAPLYEKPPIGDAPFRPLDKVRPEKTSDGLRDVMTDVASAYDKTPLSYVTLQQLLRLTKMRRLTLDKYLEDAESRGFIQRTGQTIRIQTAGRSYLSEHGIIDT